ncbi:uncharacterized protein TNCV_3063891 [Trichonephila clavipes]|nr:uncharacterized protein TNCV_3063891 [Trichonephila clavipes]
MGSSPDSSKDSSCTGAVANKPFKTQAARGLLATDHVILNHGQVTWTTPELAPPLLTTTPHQREDVSALDRFNVHRCPTRRVFSGTGLEPNVGKKEAQSLQEALNSLQNVPSKISDVLADDFSEEVPSNNLLEFSLDS